MEEKENKQSGLPRRRGARLGAGAVFFVVLAAVTVLAWMLPLRPAVSEKEKRTLERFPEFSLTALGDGGYFQQIGLWFSDTFPGRDTWIRVSQGVERLYGYSDVMIYGAIDVPDAIPLEGREPAPTAAAGAETAVTPAAAETSAPETPEEEEAYVWGGKVIEDEELISLGSVIQIGDSAYVYTGFVQSYSDDYAENISRAAELLDGRCRVFDVLVLHSTTLMLPRDYRESVGCACEEDVLDYIHGRMSGRVYGVDTFTPLLRHNDEYIYFHGDHHWTALGAWYAYEEWAKLAGVEPVGLDRYEEGVQEPFYGSLYYKANQSSRLQTDAVHTYTPPGDVHLYVQLNKDSDTDRGYEEQLLREIQGTDKYMTFLTGDLPLCTFVNNDITDGSACLIVKNSNGNPFSYYFTQHYQYVYVLDYRKYFNRTLSGFVDYYEVDDVIFCLSADQAQSRGGNELLEQLIR